MRLFAIRKGSTLLPLDAESAEAMRELPSNKPLQVEVKQPRNIQFHRLYFALCARIGDGLGKDAETISTVFKFATGHVDIVRTKSYGDVKIPKSISFAKMDGGSFKTFFERCVETCYTEWGIDPASVADLLAPQEDQARR